jgi:hypothetical protein
MALIDYRLVEEKGFFPDPKPRSHGRLFFGAEGFRTKAAKESAG